MTDRRRPTSAITPARTYVQRVETPDGPLLIVCPYDLEHSFWLEVGNAELADRVATARRPIPGDREPGFFARLASTDDGTARERAIVPDAA